MRNYPWLALLLLGICLSFSGVKAAPLVSFGLGLQTQRPSYPYPAGEPYYNNYYGNSNNHNNYYGSTQAGYYYNGGYRYPAGYPSAYPQHYPYSPYSPYSPGNRYGALDIGIGASLTPFLL